MSIGGVSRIFHGENKKEFANITTVSGITSKKEDSFYTPYLDKEYNITAIAAKGQTIQPISQFKVVPVGSNQMIDTDQGQKRVQVEYGDVLFKDSHGKQSLVSVGDIAKTHLIDYQTKQALLGVAEVALCNNQVEFDYDHYATNVYYNVNGRRYLPRWDIARKVNGLIDQSKSVNDFSNHTEDVFLN